MRKLIFAVTALFVSAAMSAQIWVGGSLGFDSKSYPTEGSKTFTEFQISPVAGYALSDVFEVGLAAGFDTQSNIGGVDGRKSSRITVEPFARWTFLNEEKISLFLQGAVGYRQVKSGDNKDNLFQVGVAPGVKIPLNENLSIVSTFGWLGFDKSVGDVKNLSLGLSSKLSFGLYYAF